MDIAAFYDSLGPAGRELLAIGLQLLLIAIATVIALRLSGIGVRAIISTARSRRSPRARRRSSRPSRSPSARRRWKAGHDPAAGDRPRPSAFLMAMQAFHLDIGPAVAGAGIIGIAIGLGGSTSCVITWRGRSSSSRTSTPKGDVVRIADVSGTVGTSHCVGPRCVTSMVRSTRCQQADRVASNLTRVWARINLDLTVAHGTDLEAASGVVKRDRPGDGAPIRPGSGVSSRAPRVDRVSSLAGEGVTLKIWARSAPRDRWAATGELRKRIRHRLRRAGHPIAGSGGAASARGLRARDRRPRP
jgi:hypothetical protein